eukprot:COSAG02_NODE_5104_length_4627_cov_3.621466_3_plen_106_part_00
MGADVLRAAQLELSCYSPFAAVSADLAETATNGAIGPPATMRPATMLVVTVVTATATRSRTTSTAVADMQAQRACVDCALPRQYQSETVHPDALRCTEIDVRRWG